MRYTEIHLSWCGYGCDVSSTSLHRGTPTLETLMQADLEGRSVVPVDSYTDCLDLLELTTGLKGVPQDRHQRLAILALREKRLAGRIRLSYWVETCYMIANALTKHDPNDECLWSLLTSGTWFIGGEVRIRYTARVSDYTEDDLYEMNRAGKPHPFATPSDGEMHARVQEKHTAALSSCYSTPFSCNMLCSHILLCNSDVRHKEECSHQTVCRWRRVASDELSEETLCHHTRLTTASPTVKSVELQCSDGAEPPCGIIRCSSAAMHVRS